MSREIKHPKFIHLVLIILFVLARPAFGRDFIFQNQDTQQQTQVKVANWSSEVQPVWVLFYGPEFMEEHSFEIPANSQKVLNLDGLKKPLWTFAVLTKSPLVKPLDSISHWEWAPGTLYEMSLESTDPISLKVLNLYLQKQKVKLTYFDAQGKILQQNQFTTASFRNNISHTLTPPEGATRLQLQSEGPLQITSSHNFKALTDESRPVSGDFKYFLVSGGSNSTSFVVPIQDPALIKRAREEIKNPQGYIVFADIELNHNQANRDFTSPQKNYWSWSIQKVTGMAQIGADWCQAYPEMIERMLHMFLNQKKVCFRGQKIIRELTPEEVHLGLLETQQLAP